ncbi:MAG: hypothetical protein KDD44_15580, partial [Bdellovibrionales bacterium]|nr:hypothetical protein [Bdellovibrionales bacterium]
MGVSLSMDRLEELPSSRPLAWPARHGFLNRRKASWRAILNYAGAGKRKHWKTPAQDPSYATT